MELTVYMCIFYVHTYPLPMQFYLLLSAMGNKFKPYITLCDIAAISGVFFLHAIHPVNLYSLNI